MGHVHPELGVVSVDLDKMTDPEEIARYVVSAKFIKGMRDRMVASYFKYGPITRESIKTRNMFETIDLRMQKYRETHNTEYLMDLANFMMIEFMVPSFDDAYFQSTDSDKSPGVVDAAGDVTHQHYKDIEERLERRAKLDRDYQQREGA